MTDSDTLIVDTLTRVLRETGDHRAGQRSSNALWRAFEETGLTRTWIDAEQGGAGASMADGFAVLRIAGSYAVDVPLAETLLAGWLLEQAAIAAPDDKLTVAPCHWRDRVTIERNTVTGMAHAVPFARDAFHIAVLGTHDDEHYVALLARDAYALTEHDNIAREPRDVIKFTSAHPAAIARTTVDMNALLLMGAAIRATQMAGALQGMLDLTVAYANERVAFEKPIGKFQAIQHSLARLAGETAAALAAAGSAADAIQSVTHFDDAVFLEVASAKIRVGEAVTAATAIAHQVHGAIGFTQEHVLHRYTQRLWSWRDDFGSESEWALRLGQTIAGRGVDALWPMLAAR